uniref:Uncharacterized protein n=1 Tax=Leersia perrieri TaxID=77586 RepID=A0A0D9WWX2_9ORYZ
MTAAAVSDDGGGGASPTAPTHPSAGGDCRRGGPSRRWRRLLGGVPASSLPDPASPGLGLDLRRRISPGGGRDALGRRGGVCHRLGGPVAFAAWGVACLAVRRWLQWRQAWGASPTAGFQRRPRLAGPLSLLQFLGLRPVPLATAGAPALLL